MSEYNLFGPEQHYAQLVVETALQATAFYSPVTDFTVSRKIRYVHQDTTIRQEAATRSGPVMRYLPMSCSYPISRSYR